MAANERPRTPLVSDTECVAQLGAAVDSGSVYDMDVVEEHRFKSPSIYSMPLGDMPPRPRSASIYSMFVTDTTIRPSCKNPSVYSMPITVVQGEPRKGTADGDHGNNNGSPLFATRQSRGLPQTNSRTIAVHHMNSRPRVKNPSVYSMPILGGSPSEVPEGYNLRTVFTKCQTPPPAFNTEVLESGVNLKSNLNTIGTLLTSSEKQTSLPTPGLKRLPSRKVAPVVAAPIPSTLCGGCGKNSDESLPASYHIAVCLCILGATCIFIGIVITIIGFSTSGIISEEATTALKALGPVLLVVGVSLCGGCFAYFCLVYMRYKRLSAYLRRRHSRRGQSTRSTESKCAYVSNSEAEGEGRNSKKGINNNRASDDMIKIIQMFQTHYHTALDTSENRTSL